MGMCPKPSSIDELKLEENRLDESNRDYLRGFRCGNPEIDRFLKYDAYAYLESGRGATYLFTSDTNELIAFYTISASALRTTDFSHEYPTVEITMFAVNTKYQNTFCKEFGAKVSDYIMWWVQGSLSRLSQKIGFQFILLKATDVRAVRFYLRNCFHLPSETEDLVIHDDSYTKDCTPMILSLYGGD